MVSTAGLEPAALIGLRVRLSPFALTQSIGSIAVRYLNDPKVVIPGQPG